MKCHLHADAEAIGTCVSCGKPVCMVCANKQGGKIYCDACAARAAAAPQPPTGATMTSNGKTKATAGILGILLGGIGIHKFYLGETGLGIAYVLFCWTGIPALVGLIEGISYLCMTDAAFIAKFDPALRVAK